MTGVLALRALGLGDLLCAVPALRALARATGGPVALAAPAWLEPVARLSGGVDRVLPTAPLAPVPWEGPPPALAVNLHGSGPQSTAVLRALRPARLVAYDAPGAPPWDDGEHERARWARLVATGLGVPADPDDLALPPPPGVASPAPGAVVVHPGGAAPARRWPAGRWAAVARAHAAAGRTVVVTGSAAEAGLAREVADAAGLDPAAVLAGRLDLPGLCALVAGARLVLSCDTGVAHLASAYGTPSVVLFGPVPPSRWGPPPARPQHACLWPGPVSDPFADGPAPALLAITPEDVLATAPPG